jgi:hypothetical protein
MLSDSETQFLRIEDLVTGADGDGNYYSMLDQIIGNISGHILDYWVTGIPYEKYEPAVAAIVANALLDQARWYAAREEQVREHERQKRKARARAR